MSFAHYYFGLFESTSTSVRMNNGQISSKVERAIEDCRNVINIFARRGCSFRDNEEDYQLFHMQIQEKFLDSWKKNVIDDYEEKLLPTICLCEDRENGERHVHLLLYSALSDSNYWDIRKDLGVPREGLRRIRIGSTGHAFNSILYLVKKYGSGKALPRSGKFGRKTCTRQWRSNYMDGLRLQPLTNDEHAYVVSVLRKEFPDVAKRDEEQLLAVEALQVASAKCHSGRKRAMDNNAKTGASTSAVPAGKMVQAHSGMGTSGNRKDTTVGSNQATTSENMHGCGGSGYSRSDDEDEWCRRAIAAGLGRSDTSTHGNNVNGTNATFNGAECLGEQNIRREEAIRTEQPSHNNQLRKRVRLDDQCGCSCHQKKSYVDSSTQTYLC